jgi:hypothetical protein
MADMDCYDRNRYTQSPVNPRVASRFRSDELNQLRKHFRELCLERSATVGAEDSQPEDSRLEQEEVAVVEQEVGVVSRRSAEDLILPFSTYSR